jgi:hypothetical protein
MAKSYAMEIRKRFYMKNALSAKPVALVCEQATGTQTTTYFSLVDTLRQPQASGRRLTLHTRAQNTKGRNISLNCIFCDPANLSNFRVLW